MAIHSAGAISFQDLINEFKVPKPVSLSQMYAGGGYVPEANAGVPKSGAISLGNFYGATAALVIDYNITADMFNFNTDTFLASYNWDGATPVILTVNIADGIVVSGDNTSTPAFVVSALPSGSQVFIKNNGFIIGMGGQGYNYTTGQDGGNALDISTKTSIDNSTGTIAGGGGGGGGGIASGGGVGPWYLSGGGGRTGRKNSNVQSSNAYGSTKDFTQASIGTFASGGTGGDLGGTGGFVGGSGGTWGADGTTSYSHNPPLNYSTYKGGRGGNAVVGNNLINWVSEGTIMGSRLN